MENASKALTIAGSVLISIIILSLLVYFFANLRNIAGADSEINDTLTSAEFNKQFDVYARNVYGTELFSLANKIKDYNDRQDEKDEGYEKIELVVVFKSDADERLKNEKNQKLFAKGTYGVEGEKSIIKQFNDLKTNLTKTAEKQYKAIEYTRTVEQLANMRTNEMNDYGFTKDVMGQEKYDDMLKKIDLYTALKTWQTRIKETAFEYKDSEYSKTTGRVIKMIYQVDFN